MTCNLIGQQAMKQVMDQAVEKFFTKDLQNVFGVPDLGKELDYYACGDAREDDDDADPLVESLFCGLVSLVRSKNGYCSLEVPGRSAQCIRMSFSVSFHLSALEVQHE